MKKKTAPAKNKNMPALLTACTEGVRDAAHAMGVMLKSAEAALAECDFDRALALRSALMDLGSAAVSAGAEISSILDGELGPEPEASKAITKKWSDTKKQIFSPGRIRKNQEKVEAAVLEM